MASSTRKLIDNIIEFVEVKTEQIKLRIISRVAKMLSAVLTFSIVALLAFFFFFFISFAFAELMNDYLSSEYYGYFIIAGVYFIFILIIILLMKSRKLQSWIESLIVNLEEAKNDTEQED